MDTTSSNSCRLKEKKLIFQEIMSYIFTKIRLQEWNHAEKNVDCYLSFSFYCSRRSINLKNQNSRSGGKNKKAGFNVPLASKYVLTVTASVCTGGRMLNLTAERWQSVIGRIQSYVWVDLRISSTSVRLFYWNRILQ